MKFMRLTTCRLTMCRLTICVACCAIAVASGGCRSTPNDTAPSPGMGDWYPAPLNDPQISVVSPELRPWLGFQPAIVTLDGQHPMRVEVPVRNSTYNKYLLGYRILFYDEFGRELDPVMSWELVPLEPKEVVRLKRSAMSTEAQSYRLEVKWAR